MFELMSAKGPLFLSYDTSSSTYASSDTESSLSLFILFISHGNHWLVGVGSKHRHQRTFLCHFLNVTFNQDQFIHVS